MTAVMLCFEADDDPGEGVNVDDSGVGAVPPPPPEQPATATTAPTIDA